MTLDSYWKILRSQQIREQDLPLNALDYHLPFLRRLDEVENSSVALYDAFTGGFRFIGKRLRFLEGDRDEAFRRGSEYFFERIHAEDLPIFLDRSMQMWNFLLRQTPEHRKDYKLVLDYRIDQGNGIFLKMVQQTIVLELDRRGNIWLLLVVNDPVPRGTAGQFPQAAIVHLPTGREQRIRDYSWMESEADVSAAVPLSRREVEILKLVADGLASKEIAWHLNISINTVNNHRQRILRKTSTRNSPEAITYASERGLI